MNQMDSKLVGIGDDLRGKRVTVAGLGRFGGGTAVAKWLVGQGATVQVTDQADAASLAESVAALDGLPIEFTLGGHREKDFTDCEVVVTSPAVPPSSPFLQAAHRAGVPVTTEICLFAQHCKLPVIGITGTKGKSTTTALLSRMLGTRHTVWTGGNIGKSLLAELPAMKDGELVLLELSSFMLHYLGQMRWRPQTAIVTMVSSDHLDWHGSREAYLGAKQNLVRYQTAEDDAVLCGESDDAKAFANVTAARVHLFDIESAKAFALQMAGRHNQHNAQGAFMAAALHGVSWEDAQRSIAEFSGLAHRMELVGEVGGVRYYNDSIATIPDAALAGLRAFPAKRVVQIVGGYDKGLSMSPLCDALRAEAKAVLCIGTLGEALAERCEGGSARVERSGELSTAVEAAKKIAAPGDVVLLSPGCASYDQFANFEKRGDAFRKLVQGG